MTSHADIDAELGVEALRSGFLKYTREAYALLPALDQPRILDVGCGSGSATLELARLSGSKVVAIDTDASALAQMQRCIAEAGLGRRVEAINASLYDAAFADESFDLLWEEGVLHLLDSARSLPACRRLLKPGGYLVMHETVAWFEATKEQLRASGFSIASQLLLPKRCWWTDYYALLESRVHALREEHGAGFAS